MLTVKELTFLVVMLLIVLPMILSISGCSTIGKPKWESAEKVCLHHGGLRAYTAKNFLKHDALCNDGSIITNWPMKLAIEKLKR